MSPFDVPEGALDPTIVAQQQPKQPAPQFEPVTGPMPTRKEPSIWRQILGGVMQGMQGGLKAPTPEEAAGYGAEEADPNSATNIRKKIALEQNTRAQQEADLNAQQVQQAWEKLKMEQGQWDELAPFRNLYKLQLEKEVSQMPQEFQLRLQQSQGAYITALANAGFRPAYVTDDSYETMQAMMQDLEKKQTKPEDMPLPVHDRVNNRILWFHPSDGRNTLPNDFPDITLPSGKRVKVAGLPFQTADTVISAYSAYDVAGLHAAQQARMAQQAQMESDINILAEQLIDPRNLTALKDVASLRGNQRVAVFAAAARLAKSRGETFDPGLINQRIKFLNSYENPTGTAARNRMAINNIMQHAGDLADLNQKYRRANMKALNIPLNALAGQYNELYTQLQTTQAVLKDEAALYFAGGYAPTDIQKRTWDRILSGTATAAQTEAFAKELIHLGLRRASTYNSQFRTNMGYDDPDMLTPDAVNAAHRIFGDYTPENSEENKRVLKEISKYGSGGVLGRQPAAAAAPTAPPAASGWGSQFGGVKR